jgi:hypothetical protein
MGVIQTEIRKGMLHASTRAPKKMNAGRPHSTLNSQQSD